MVTTEVYEYATTEILNEFSTVRIQHQPILFRVYLVWMYNVTKDGNNRSVRICKYWNFEGV